MVDWEPGEVERTLRYRLCHWEGGGELWRIVGKEDATSAGDVILGYFQGGQHLDTVEFWNIGWNMGPVEVTRSNEAAPDESKIDWYLWATTPKGWLLDAKVEEMSRLVLTFPKRFPEALMPLLDPSNPLEATSRQIGASIVGRRWTGKLGPLNIPHTALKEPEVVEARVLFRSMEEAGMGRAGVSDLVHGFQSSPCLFFDVEGDDDGPYLIACEAWHRSPSVVPSRSRNQRAGLREGKQAFTVYQDQADSDYDLLGVGRTVGEALADVTRFVRNGDEADWASQFDSGSLELGDTQLYELVGEFAPCWWSSEAFAAWAEEMKLVRRPS